MSHCSLVSFFVGATAAGCVAPASSQPCEGSCDDALAAVASPESGFFYDPTSGTCRDATNVEGYNPLDVDALFGPAVTDSAQNVTIADRHAECVDFEGFDFYAYLHPPDSFKYADLLRWDLRGAKLDGSNLSWTTFVDAQMGGTQFRAATFGYTMVFAVVDANTQQHASCVARQEHLVECIR
jgi:hypothetical protein